MIFKTFKVYKEVLVCNLLYRPPTAAIHIDEVDDLLDGLRTHFSIATSVSDEEGLEFAFYVTRKFRYAPVTTTCS